MFQEIQFIVVFISWIIRSRTLLKSQCYHKRIVSRIEWAKSNITNDCQYAIFADEASIWLSNGTVRMWTKRERLARGLHLNTPKNTHLGRIFLSWYLPSLYFTDILTAPLFINILVHLLAQAHVFHQDKWFLVMDNDPKHTAKVSKAWMSNKIHGKRLDWPSQSPDVNPIENLFGWIKNELMKRGPRTIPSFKHELEEFYKHQ